MSRILWIVVLSANMIAAFACFGAALFLLVGGLSRLTPQMPNMRFVELLMAGMLGFVALLTLLRSHRHYQQYVVGR